MAYEHLETSNVKCQLSSPLVSEMLENRFISVDFDVSFKHRSLKPWRGPAPSQSSCWPGFVSALSHQVSKRKKAPVVAPTRSCPNVFGWKSASFVWLLNVWMEPHRNDQGKGSHQRDIELSAEEDLLMTVNTYFGFPQHRKDVSFKIRGTLFLSYFHWMGGSTAKRQKTTICDGTVH